MSTLNLTLQMYHWPGVVWNQSLKNDIHNKNTLSEIHEATDRNPGLTEALKDSMSSPLITIEQTF